MAAPGNPDPLQAEAQRLRQPLRGRRRIAWVLVLLVAACIGALVGLLAGLFQALRLRREVAALKRELRAVKQSSAAPLLPPSDLL